MPSVRTMVVAGVSGALGAVLLVVLVLGRGEQRALLTLDQLQAEGGVVWFSQHAYERPAFEQEAERPARTVIESWTVWESGQRTAVYVASRDLDGTTLHRAQMVDGAVEPFPEPVDPRIEWPAQRGSDVGSGDVSCDAGHELVPGERSGSAMCVGPYPQPSSERVPNAFFPAWPVDLDVASVQREVRFNPNGGVSSVIHRATLEDGSVTDIASLRFRMTYLTLAEWDEIRETVFGDVAGAG